MSLAGATRRALGTPRGRKLAGRPVRNGDKVQILPQPGNAPKAINDCGVSPGSRARSGPAAKLVEAFPAENRESATIPVSDLRANELRAVGASLFR